MAYNASRCEQSDFGAFGSTLENSSAAQAKLHSKDKAGKEGVAIWKTLDKI